MIKINLKTQVLFWVLWGGGFQGLKKNPLKNGISSFVIQNKPQYFHKLDLMFEKKRSMTDSEKDDIMMNVGTRVVRGKNWPFGPQVGRI